MSSSSTGQPKRAKSSSRKSARTSGRPNRAQIRAAEARTVVQASPSTAAVVAVPGAQAVSRGRRQIARVFSLSRDAELNYIRNDLRRLIYTGGILLVLMLLLLFIID